jgi:hypothetical protein
MAVHLCISLQRVNPSPLRANHHTTLFPVFTITVQHNPVAMDKHSNLYNLAKFTVDARIKQDPASL